MLLRSIFLYYFEWLICIPFYVARWVLASNKTPVQPRRSEPAHFPKLKKPEEPVALYLWLETILVSCGLKLVNDRVLAVRPASKNRTVMCTWWIHDGISWSSKPYCTWTWIGYGNTPPQFGSIRKKHGQITIDYMMYHDVKYAIPATKTYIGPQNPTKTYIGPQNRRFLGWKGVFQPPIHPNTARGQVNSALLKWKVIDSLVIETPARGDFLLRRHLLWDAASSQPCSQVCIWFLENLNSGMQ